MLDFDGGFGIGSGYHLSDHMWTVVSRSGGSGRGRLDFDSGFS